MQETFSICGYTRISVDLEEDRDNTSKKVRNVIKRRQADGKRICSVPYGCRITNTKTMAFEVDEPAAEIVRKVFELYNSGWGYKRIANRLTEQYIPTPRIFLPVVQTIA